jgi:hypothetical protein
VVGLSAGTDSIAVHWTEPRSGDPAATVEGGVTVRPRGLVLNMASFDGGEYVLEVSVDRAGTVVRTRRTLTIDR